MLRRDGFAFNLKRIRPMYREETLQIRCRQRRRTAMNITTLPKTELHVHLDCSLSYTAVCRIDPSVSREHFERAFVLRDKVVDLADFLGRIPNSLDLLQQAVHLDVAVQDLVDQLVADGVIYAEVRFAPFLHLEQGMTAQEVTACVAGSLDSACERTGLEARLILCTLRHFDSKTSMQTAELVQEFRSTRVAGLDLAADEAGFPLDAHRAAFAFAHKAGLSTTAHAGEALGAASVLETLDLLSPSRIGHGVRSIEDPACVERLVRENIHLEVCPSCNVIIDVFDDLASHPVDALLRAGVSLGINTDGRTVPQLTLTGQYELLREVFGWGLDEFEACNRNAIEAAFIPPVLMELLRERIATGFARQRSQPGQQS